MVKSIITRLVALHNSFSRDGSWQRPYPRDTLRALAQAYGPEDRGAATRLEHRGIDKITQ